MKKLSLFALSFMLTGFVGLNAHAAGITAQQTIEKVVAVAEKSDGTVEFTYAPAEAAAPGEQLVYTIAFSNTGGDAAENVVLSMPIEPEVTYVEGSALTPDAMVTFSADHGRTFAARADLTVTGADGQPRAAGATDITDVRWTLTKPLAGGAAGTVSLRAVLK